MWVGLSYPYTPIVGSGLCSLLPNGPFMATPELCPGSKGREESWAGSLMPQASSAHPSVW